MASNKESIVMIVDVGVGAEELTKLSAECALTVIKNKIYNHKVDMLSLLLLRTEQTENVANSETTEQYLNICQVLPGSQLPSWYMAKEFISALERNKSKNGDWVDALIVAIGIITEDAELHKARTSKIVLFHNFDSLPTSLDEAIVAKLNDIDSQLIVVSNKIHYIPDSEGNLHPQFKAVVGKPPSQTKNEELAMKLLKACPSMKLCNFNDALSLILRKELRRPWSWNTTLVIGTRIIIHISGVIAIKEDDKVPKFKKISRDQNEVISREKNYYSGIDEQPAQTKENLISGYMLGNTPMAYDPSLGQESHIDTKKGVHFIGFVQADNIPQEHFAGQSTYVLFAQKLKRVSAKMIHSLVRVMLANNLSILGWKVYSNGQRPKLVVLLPTMEHKLPGLSMIELSYHSQHRFWDFPKLATKKNQPTADQLSAVDELMAAMDLSRNNDTNEDQKPCDSLITDHLPFDSLPNIRQQHLIDYLSSVVLEQAPGTPPQEVVKIPDFFQPKASAAAEKIKELFRLEKAEISTKEKLKKHFDSIIDDDGQVLNQATTSSTALGEEDFKLTCVGTVNPAEDFKALIAHVMSRMPNGTERSAKFHQYACQMRAVISDLLFKSMTKQNEKIENAMVAYRVLTIAANSQYDYNDWMRQIRAKVIERKMFDFWKDVVVKHKLGLCMEDDTQAEDDFYDISKEINAATNVETCMEDDETVEDLFGNM